ncbi:MAG: leucine-rich repeat domain-containing protein [Muribaculaceae bacterium]|nr:leucine-rich repeat domain-containing protein [Muribaculaceae bacterium]
MKLNLLVMMALSSVLAYGGIPSTNVSQPDYSDLISGSRRILSLPENACVLPLSDVEVHVKKPVLARSCSKPFRAETTGYGQLKAILDANGGAGIDSLTVAGPMDISDFKTIWDCAVYGNLTCLNLGEASIKDNDIPDRALYDPIQWDQGFLLKIKKIILPEDVERIGVAALALMALEEINMPSKLRAIESSVFLFDRYLNCPLVFPEGLEEIRYQAFHDCFSLSTTPILPGTLKKIGVHAFSGTQIEGIEFPESLEEIMEGAFVATSLTKVYLPDNCLKIGPMAFQGCHQLKEVRLPKDLERIPYGLFSQCRNVDFQTITLNEGCRVIGSNAFQSTFIKEINYNDKIECIEYEAFNGTNIEEVIIPESIKTLGWGCFSNTYPGIKSIYCQSPTPPTCEIEEERTYTPFGSPGSLADINLFVPCGAKEAYSKAPCWRDFVNIIETNDFPGASVWKPGTGDNTGSDTTPIYDLSGRQINNPQHGEIYIRNGIKYIK